jgi:drug/metabolite transporter (DMT)-like permease
MFLIVGGQMVFTTENAPTDTIEAPFTVAWVWLTFGETPSSASVAGGLIVVAAVATHVGHKSHGRISG